MAAVPLLVAVAVLQELEQLPNCCRAGGVTGAVSPLRGARRRRASDCCIARLMNWCWYGVRVRALGSGLGNEGGKFALLSSSPSALSQSSPASLSAWGRDICIAWLSCGPSAAAQNGSTPRSTSMLKSRFVSGSGVDGMNEDGGGGARGACVDRRTLSLPGA